MSQDLSLTQDQKDKLKAEREAGKQAREEVFAGMKEIRLAAKTELLKDKPDQSVLDGLAQKAADLHKQMMSQEQAHLLRVKSILKPDQFAKLLDRQGKMHPGPQCGPQLDGKCPKSGKDCKEMKKGCEGPGGMGGHQGDPL